MVHVEPAAPAVAILITGRARATRAGVRHAPMAPGCYLFKDDAGATLYVGKSVAIRQRLVSYFLPKRDRKTRLMTSHAHEVEWQTVASEVEALILESQLIKQLQPPYNVLGREYPHYTFLRLAGDQPFPYLELTDTVAADGAAYYGPFWSRRSAEQTAEFVNRLFQLRACDGPLPTPAIGRACFHGQVRRCSAPCLGLAPAADYAARVQSAGQLLRGDVGPLVKRLERERDRAAAELRYEHAGSLHQIVTTLRSLQGKRRHLRSAASTVNFLVLVRQPHGERAQVLAFSAARLRGQLTFPAILDEARLHELESFILAQYPSRRALALDLEELDQMHVVAEWLARQGRSAVYVPLPEGQLTAGDARRAADAVAQALAN